MSEPSKFSTGIDFSDRSIQIVQLEYTKGKLKSVLTEEILLKSGTIILGEIVNQIEFDAKLNQLLDRAESVGFTFDNTVLSIPEEYIKVILVDVSGDTEDSLVDKLVLDRVESELPGPSKNWKYEVFDINVHSKHKFLFLGVETEKLLTYSRNVSEFGIDIRAVEPDNITLLRNIPTDGPHIAVDFGEYKTIFYFMIDHILHKRLILDYGAERMMSSIYKESGLKQENEEKLFKRIGYSKKTDSHQKKILKSFFKDINSKLKTFIIDIEADYGIKISSIYTTGGLSNLIGIKKLLTRKYKYKIITPLVSSPVIGTNFLNALGAALTVHTEGMKINFLTKDLKKLIANQINGLMEVKEEQLLKKELERITTKSKLNDINLENTFKARWDTTTNVDISWKLSFRLTAMAQFLIMIIFGLVLVGGTLFKVDQENLVIQKGVQLHIEKTEPRDYFYSKFPLSVIGGDIKNLGDSAMIIGRFGSYIFELDKKYMVTSAESILTQGMIDKAAKDMENIARTGTGYKTNITIKDNEFIIPTAVNFSSAQEGSDIQVGQKVKSFTYSMRAVVDFAIIDSDRFTQIIDQRLSKSLRTSEQKDADKYNVLNKRFFLNKFDLKSNLATFNIFFEASK